MTAAHDRSGDAPRPARMRKAERRRQLLGFATIGFATAGFAATSTAQIAETAGVTEALLARYFETKEAILLAILADIRTVSLDRWRRELEALGDPHAKLHAVADLFLKTVNEYGLAFQLLHRLLLDGADEPILEVLRGRALDPRCWSAAGRHHRRRAAAERSVPSAVAIRASSAPGR